MLDFLAARLSDRRTIGPSDYRAVGILSYNAHARCLIQKNTGADDKPRFSLYVRRKSVLPLHICRLHAFYFDTTLYSWSDNVNIKSVWLNNLIDVCNCVETTCTTLQTVVSYYLQWKSYEITGVDLKISVCFAFLEALTSWYDWNHT